VIPRIHCRAARPPGAVHGAGASSMQSTGQAGMHSSQPVHSGAMTVCISFAAPVIASTGQAWMHLVQPMQSGSMIRATCGGLCVPRRRS